jgi:hypothetical protein
MQSLHTCDSTREVGFQAPEAGQAGSCKIPFRPCLLAVPTLQGVGTHQPTIWQLSTPAAQVHMRSADTMLHLQRMRSNAVASCVAE